MPESASSAESKRISKIQTARSAIRCRGRSAKPLRRTVPRAGRGIGGTNRRSRGQSADRQGLHFTRGDTSSSCRLPSQSDCGSLLLRSRLDALQSVNGRPNLLPISSLACRVQGIAVGATTLRAPRRPPGEQVANCRVRPEPAKVLPTGENLARPARSTAASSNDHCPPWASTRPSGPCLADRPKEKQVSCAGRNTLLA